jgi:quercetin dioxygenase-like cupin family protein
MELTTTRCCLARRGLALSCLLATLIAAPLSQATADEDHTLLRADEVKWSPGPPSIPPGAEAAVLYGNPGEAELFALRLRLPAGYLIPPHVHPRPEIVTVISGTFHIGMGETADRGATEALGPGAFFAFAPGVAHFAYTDEETVIQLNSTGPWSLQYVNPQDDPRT